ncbi:MAG: hypothetical protein ACK4TP_03620 [Hyphomicrobium sp.]|jgi:hypothetical protein
MNPSIIRTATLLMMTFLAAAAVRADGPAFVGTWSLDPANCGAAQESESAPLVIAKDRYDQHESHCTFKSVSGGNGEWKIASECMIEGSPTPYDFSLTLSGDTLTFTDSGGPRDFLRCK